MKQGLIECEETKQQEAQSVSSSVQNTPVNQERTQGGEKKKRRRRGKKKHAEDEQAEFRGDGGSQM